MVDINFLRIPLYKLHYIDDLEHFSKLNREEMEALGSEYTEDEVVAIKDAIAWAVNNPNHNFSSMLPGIGYNNTEIYNYLCKLHSSNF